MRVCHLWWKACEQGQGAWASDLSIPRLNPTSLNITSVAMLLHELPLKLRIIKSTMPKYMGNGCTECYAYVWTQISKYQISVYV